MDNEIEKKISENTVNYDLIFLVVLLFLIIFSFLFFYFGLPYIFNTVIQAQEVS